jgi:beta-lactam-binding protein with PASTA domain
MHKRPLVTMLMAALLLTGCGAASDQPDTAQQSEELSLATARAEAEKAKAEAEKAEAEAETAKAEAETAKAEAEKAQAAAAAAPVPDAPAPAAPAAPAPVEAAPGPVAVPAVIGLDHQLAQDTMQAAGLYNLSEEDATGAGRMLILDRGWVVVGQVPAAGSQVASDATITLSSKKKGE